MKTLVIEKEKITHNLGVIDVKSGGAPMIAVLKANAYGLGLCQMAKILAESGVRRWAVTEPQDAVTLRDAGFAEQEILILRSTSQKDDVAKIISSTSTATIGSYDAAVALNGMAASEGAVVDVHIEIDTGMGRYGFEPSELERIFSVFRFMENLHVAGMYTHFPSAFSSKKSTLAAQEKLVATAARVRAEGFEPGMIHAANSAGMFCCDLPALDAIRIGSAIGGRVICKKETGLQKTGKLESEVAEVRWLPKGHGVGYGPAFVTKKPTRIAIIPVGTADGFMVEKARDSFRFRDCLRMALSDISKWIGSKKFHVTVGGRKARVIGHVGISHTTVDVTNIDCEPGTKAVFDVAPMFVPAEVERKYV